MYKAIGKTGHEYDLDFKEGQLYIGGDPFELDLVEIDKNNFHILKGSVSYRVEILKMDKAEKKFIFRINGNEYPISLKDNSDILLNKLGLSSALSDAVSEVKAPMPGLILGVFIQEGSEIKKGEPLLILEAMKMENILKSPRDGIVKSIMVAKGKSVEKNQILIKF